MSNCYPRAMNRQVAAGRGRRDARARRRFRRRATSRACSASAGATIVSPQNSMLYTPLLPEAASGTLEPRHVVVPLRQMCPHAELVLGRAVIARHADARTVAAETIGGPVEIGYERLVVALGAVPRTFPVPGLAEHGRGFKDLADAIALRNHVLRAARVAAAGSARPRRPSSGSSSSAPATPGSRRSPSSTTSSRRRSAVLPDAAGRPAALGARRAAPTILAEIPRRLGKYAARELERRGIEIHVATTLELVRRRDGGPLRRHGGAGAHARLDRRGARPIPAPRGARPPAGRARAACASTRCCGSTGSSDVWALGDGAAVPNSAHARARPTRRPASTRSGRPAGSPRTSRARRARTATGCWGRWRRSGATRASPTCSGSASRGFLGWFVARTYHLYALPLAQPQASRRRRLDDSLFFRRDIAELSALGHPDAASSRDRRLADRGSSPSASGAELASSAAASDCRTVEHPGEEVAVPGDPVEHRVHRERRGIEPLAHLVPRAAASRRARRPAAGPSRPTRSSCPGRSGSRRRGRLGASSSSTPS